MKALLTISDIVQRDIAEARSVEMNAQNKTVSISAMVEYLLHDAIAIRKYAPDVVADLYNLRKKYHNYLRESGDFSVDDPDISEKRKFKLGEDIKIVKAPEVVRVDGLPISLFDVIEAINKMGRVAHDKEIAMHLGISKQVARSRTKRLLSMFKIRRVDLCIYTTKEMIAGQMQLDDKEQQALARAHQWSKRQSRD